MISRIRTRRDARDAHNALLQNTKEQVRPHLHKDTTMDKIIEFFDNITIWELNGNETISYEISPAIPDFVYIAACIAMAIIGCFGIPANLSIFVLFFNSPLVSLVDLVFS